MITTADLFIMRLWKAQEECAVQACVVGIEVHVTVKADSFFSGLHRTKKLQMQEIFEHIDGNNWFPFRDSTRCVRNRAPAWPTESTSIYVFRGVGGSATLPFKHCTLCASQLE